MGKVDGFYNLLPCHCHFTAIQKASLYTFCHNVLGSILMEDVLPLPPFSYLGIVFINALAS